jgi:NAD-dependent dihydropyrimidine dehydrogenase PreA subunit
MAYVITDTCTKDELCVEACPVNCIHPTKDEPDFEQVKQLFVNPDDCIDCGACIPVCPTSSVYSVDELPPELGHFVQENANHYAA